MPTEQAGSKPAKILYLPVGLASSVIGGVVAQGAVFATVKAAIQRGGARGFERWTGEWPGD